VVAGGHAAHLTRQIFGQLWPWVATHADEANPFPASKLPIVHDAILARCDMLDGVKDGVLENPLACTFDSQELACTGADGPGCLTAAQVDAVRKIYEGPINPRTNERIWSPLYPGSELDWKFFVDSTNPIGIATNMLRIIKQDPDWDVRRTPIDWDRDVELADRSDMARLNASNPDISEYVRRGGKLILSGGWSNALVPAGAVLDYYTRVEATIGRSDTQHAVRLYMVPGMSECNGGPGTDTFDLLTVMRRWVERGEAPHEVRASRVEHGTVVRTRPLCPYPLVTTYTGSGSTDDASSFVCR
jgi:feruloyl esterase